MTAIEQGKAEMRALLAKKIGCSEDAITRFVAGAKKKLAGKSEAFRAIKEYLRKGDIAGAKKHVASRMAEKFGTDEATLGRFVTRAKQKFTTNSMKNFKGQARKHLSSY